MIKFFDAFISYGRAESKDFAEKLHQRLTQRGFQVWFDQRDIPYSVDYQLQIDDGIEKADNFIFIIAPHSVKSPYCRKEIELAVQRHKRIIPLLHVKADELKEQTHPIIRKIQRLEFQEGINDFEKSFADLIKVIQNHEDYVKQHTQFLAKALEWESHQKQTSCLLIREEKQQAQDWLKRRFKDEQPPCLPTDLHCEYITESIKNANNLMTQVFISYADEDRATMEKIANSLRGESITVWTNTTDIQTGEAFEEAIKRGIEQADNVVYLLSPDSVKSYFTRQELDYALSLNKRIIPVLVRETSSESIPSALRDLHNVDLTDNVREEDYHLDESQLLRILRQDEAYYNEHKVLLTKALKWKRQHENPSILLRGYNLHSAQTWLNVANKRTLQPPTPLIEEFIAESLRQPPAESLDVFISYSRADADFARKLNDELQLQGKTTWFDQESIASGADFAQEICQGINACDNFLFILSPRSVNSPYCVEEVEYAAQLNKRFVTLLHRQVNSDELHPELAKVQWIDFNQNPGDFNANFRQLVRTLDTDREHLRSHTKWSQRALEWEEKGKSADLLLRGSEFVLAENWLQETEQKNKRPVATPLQKEYILESGNAIATARKKEKRQVTILRSLLGVVSVALVAVAGLGWLAYKREQEAMRSQRQAEKGEIDALIASSEAHVAVGQHFQALPLGLKAAKKLKNADWTANETQLRAKVVTALQQSLYQIKEINTLEGHEGGIADVSFSADGKTIATVGNDKTVKLWQRDGTLSSSRPFENSKNLEEGGTFSPNGQIIATRTRDKKVKLWRRDGTPLPPLQDQQGQFEYRTFSSDSQTIVTFSKDKDKKTNQFKFWQLDGRLLSTFEVKSEQYSYLFGERSLSPDGRTIALVNYDKTVKSYNVELRRQNGTLITTLKGDKKWLIDVRFSPNGRMIATTSQDKTVKLWKLDGKLITTLPHEKDIQSVRFSPNGRTIATTNEDNTVNLWRLDGRKPFATLKGHEGRIVDVSFSTDSRTIATASYDKTAKLWQLDGTLLANFTGHNDWVTKVRFSPDGKMLVSLSDDYKVKLWNPDNRLQTSIESDSPAFFTHRDQKTMGQFFATTLKEGPIKLWKADGTPIKTLIEKSEGDVSASFFNNGQTLVTTINKSEKFYGPVQIWKANGTIIRTLIKKTPSKGSVSLYPSNYGQTLVTGIQDENFYGPVQLWKADGTLIRTLIKKTPSKGSIWTNVSVSDDGQRIVTTVRDENSYRPVQLWKADGTFVRTLIQKTPSKGFVWVSFSPDSQRIVTTVRDENSYYTAKLWKADGTFVKTVIDKSQGWPDVRFSNDGKTLVTIMSDENSYRTAKLWKADGTSVKTLIDKSQELIGVSFSNDSQTLVTSVNDGSVKLWKTDGTLRATIIEKSKGFWMPWSFSPDNKTIALENQRTIKLWNLDGTIREIPTDHGAAINMVIFSPEGKTIASGSSDSTVKLWERRNGTLISTLKGHKGWVNSLVFSADSKILTSTDEKTVIVRHLDGMTNLDGLLAKGCKRMAVYLQKSPKLEESDRTLCNDIGKK